ncbi:MAG: hypothetical protein MI861_26025 [Pirellulales bacterium]|nr:hypothetical protein [Pirellulales bacterium]
MSETIDDDRCRWFVKYESPADGADEIGPLSEAELQHVLRRAGDRIDTMFVKQGGSDWHPAKAVRKKFERLARDGIYLRCQGIVDGPFTAAKTIQVLESMDLEKVQTKVGIHADWVPAKRLLRRLKEIQATADQKPSQDSEAAAELTGELTGDMQAIMAAAELVPIELVEDAIVVAEAVSLQPTLELVMVAEPVLSPQPSPDQPVEPVRTPRPTRAHSASKTKLAQRNWFAYSIAILGMAVAIGGGVVIFLRREYPQATAKLNGPAVGQDISPRDQPQAETAVVERPAPVVQQGTLFRPSFQTSLGPASGGTLFAARQGRSDRTVLIGAAHLLGRSTGLKRQLRGAEVLIRWESLTVVDCVSDRQSSPAGKPLRLQTAEYPSISVHGDALAFEPADKSEFEPLPIASQLPEPDDRVWLLAPARGTQALVHGGRWIGKEGDWLHYRLDHQALDMVGTSGGALVNEDHQVIGIHVASGEANQEIISIASPIRSIISEIR